MSIDLSRVTGISDSRGVITEIKDSLGRVIWAVSGGKAVLMVEKITSNTYAGETTYTGEQFILLDIYPKTNGTVKITYGGLTKTITDTSGAAEPNAIQVFFGTFNGVTDSVATPASGTLTIAGDFIGFGLGHYAQDGNYKKDVICHCVTAVEDTGCAETIPTKAFSGSTSSLKKVILNEGVKRIESEAFADCRGLEQMVIPKSVTHIAPDAFYFTSSQETITWGGTFLTIDNNNANYSFVDNCLIRKTDNTMLFGFSGAVIPNGVVSIYEKACYSHAGMPSNFVIPNTVKSIGDRAFYSSFGIVDLTIGSGVTTMGQGVFYGIDELITVRVLATTPPSAEDTGSTTYMFSDNKNLERIIVPKGCSAAYKSAPQWKRFASFIVEAS